MKRLITSIFAYLLLAHAAVADEGMWIPMYLEQMNEQEMKALGMNISAEDIYSVNQSSLKDAVMIFGRGCTAELVSDEGLIFTNHHCGYGYIQDHSSLENDYLKEGFWAMDRSQELANPGLTVTFLVRMEEVTDQVLEGVGDDMTEAQRNQSVERNIDTVNARATRGTHYSSVVKPFFYGNRYFLFVNEVFQDVRLVGVPPSNIGDFGGDTDNWVWPRHTGDFSIFRIYADKDNNPAKYSEDNVPYKPKRHLNISLEGVEEGDFTFVFGYPGSTSEYIPSRGIGLQVNTVNPVRISLRDKRIAIFNKYMEQSPEIRIQYSDKLAGISNGWKKWIGENRGIKRVKAIDKKQACEAEFTGWVNASEARMKEYGKLLPEFEKRYNDLDKLEYNATYLREIYTGIEILRYASRFQKLVMLSGNKSTQQEMEAQVERLKRGAPGYFKEYQAVIDREVFVELMRAYFADVDRAEIPEGVVRFYNNHKGDLMAMADDLFDNSLFASQEKVLEFLDKYTAGKHVKIEKDPAYQLAAGLSSRYNNTYLPVLVSEGRQVDSLMRHYMKAQMEMDSSRQFYPDANLTLRVTYGQVRGFSPDDAKDYNYFTTMKGIMEKEDPEIYDYVVDDRLKDLYLNKDYGQYGEGDGTMHVCFIATNHTAGGNSGSPVLDADGNLVGLNFDRCWESTMSDLYYDVSQCRNIALDIRYCLFIIDKLAGAGHLLDEMTIVQQPSRVERNTEIQNTELP